MTDGAGKGQLFCPSGPKDGFCYVNNSTCAQVNSKFSTFYVEMADKKAFKITKDSYLQDGVSTNGTNYCTVLI